MERLEEMNSDSADVEDSVNKYNGLLCELLLSDGFAQLDQASCFQLAGMTGMNISVSKDSSIIVMSWSVFNRFPVPGWSNIIIREGHPALFSLNGAGDRDFGENISLDGIVELVPGHGNAYLLYGSSKCGNLCVRGKAMVYKFEAGNWSQCSRVFYDGQQSLDELFYEYVPNENSRSDPGFKIKGRHIMWPVLSADGQTIIGQQEYLIDPCKI